MNGADPNAARALLEAARVAFESMTAASDSNGTLAADVSRPAAPGLLHSEPLTMAVRARGAWGAAQQVLQLLTGRTDLEGQALVAEVRRLELLSLDDAHAIVALHSWMERSTAPGSAAHSLTITPTTAEQTVATAALSALEHAVSKAAPSATPAMLPEWTPVATPTVAPAIAPSAHPSPHEPTVHAPPIEPAPDIVPTAGASQSSAWVILLVVIGLLLGAGSAGWYLLEGRGEAATSTAFTEGVAAYQRGAMEVARQAFVRASQADPADARPLIFLGRISREAGDLAQSRRYLENAVRLAPDDELALRELGSVMLADGQPELARRFYVRALERDPSDKLAQGFLGCALIQLQRVEEGRRWLARAGNGDWSRCVADTTQAPR